MTIQTIIRPATINDWPYIDSLRKREGNALGFIPKDTYLSCLSRIPIDKRRRWEYQILNIATDNDDPTGYCYVSFASMVAKIIQIVVQEDARRWHRALLLETSVRDEARRRGCSGISCRVAIDLESNFFWRSIGYTPIRQVISTWLNQKDSKCKRPLWVYYSPLELPMFANSHLYIPPYFSRRQQRIEFQRRAG